jgi:hypothetical protein
LPASYTFKPSDSGFHVFQVTFNTAGSQTVTATDQNSLHGSDDTQVQAAPVVDHFMVELPSATPAGVPTNVTVIAVDANGHRVPSYTGTVTLTSSDMAAVLPASFTFGAGDRGYHTFQVTYSTVGGQTVTATDTNNIMGIGATLVQAAPVADHLVVHVPDNAAAGDPVNVTVAVVDAHGRLVPNYIGTVAITSSDTAAVLPANFTFAAADHGHHVFQVTFNTPGDQTVTATDTVTATITGKDTVTVHAVGAVTHFGICDVDFAVPGEPIMAKVVALDANNQVVAGYTGTVHFTSSDTKAVLPGDYTFVAGDHGSHFFTVTFNTAGPQTLTATDTVTSSITGQTQVWVFWLFHRFDPFFTLPIVP